MPLGSTRPFAAVRLDVDTLEQVLELSPLGLGFRRGVGCWCVGLVPQPVGELLDVIGIPPKGFQEVRVNLSTLKLVLDTFEDQVGGLLAKVLVGRIAFRKPAGFPISVFLAVAGFAVLPSGPGLGATAAGTLDGLLPGGAFATFAAGFV